MNMTESSLYATLFFILVLHEMMNSLQHPYKRNLRNKILGID